MRIINLSANELSRYCRTQLLHWFPNGEDVELSLIDRYLHQALERLEYCIAHVRIWTPGEFDVLHSTQYCTFLYYLANTIWRAERAQSVCTKLFLLNKSLNAIDLFYEIELPEIFLIGHSVGIVFAKATYGNRLVIFQNSTIGKNRGVAPVLEEDVVLYPNAAVLGSSLVRQGSIVARGVTVLNQTTEPGQLVFQGADGVLRFKPTRRDFRGEFFRERV
ncbi:MAG: hypothetical protein G8237_05690 [Magnetococcales bacterium]|nr:hypothetical protein [Magnetococcales bacterium]